MTQTSSTASSGHHSKNQAPTTPCLTPQFIHSLHKNLPDHGIAYSPFSIHVLLSMMALGLKLNSSSLKQIETILKMDHGKNEAMMASLRKTSLYQSHQLEFDNMMFPEVSLKLKTAYKKSLLKFYEAHCMPLEYKKNPDECRREINKIVEEKTHGNIKELVPKGCLDTLTRNVLVNTVHFRGNWKEPFNVSHTEKKKFTLLSGKHTEVDMMSARSRNVVYTEYGTGKQKVSSVRLPFEGDEMEMEFVKPHSADGLRHAEEMVLLGTPHISQCKKNISLLQIPKFTVRSKMEMVEVLKSIGITDIFFQENRDFSEMIESDSPMYVSAFWHEAVVVVNEKGAEASAASFGALRRKSAKQEPFNFILDCPFVFRILYRGEPLFVGRVMDPNHEK